MNSKSLSPKIASNGSARVGTVILILVALAVLLLLFLHKSSAVPKTQKIVINQAAKTLLYLPLYIAQDNGYFKQQGINVTIITGGGDSQAFAAVLGGSADVAQGDPMMVPISRQQGGPGKIIGDVVGRVAFWGVAVNSKILPITSPKAFLGKRVVTYPAPNTIYALQERNLQQAGLKLNQDSFIVPAQFGTELAPVFSGNADIAMTLEPVVSQAMTNGAHVVYSFPEQYGDFPLTGIMVKEDLIQKNPELVQHIVNAYQKALSFAYQSPDGAVAVAIKEFPDVDKTILENAVRRMLAEQTIPKYVTITKTAYEKAENVRRDIGDLKKDVSFEDAVDNSFAETAVRQYGIK